MQNLKIDVGQENVVLFLKCGNNRGFTNDVMFAYVHEKINNLLSVLNILSFLFIPRHTIVAGYYGFTLDVRVSVRPSVRPSVVRPSLRFSFPDDNLSKHQWIFTKLGMCFDIVEIWFGIANGRISSNLPETRPYFRFRTITWENNKGF